MSEKWVRDTGLVFALVALLFAYKGFTLGIPGAALLLLAVMFFPKALWPLAWTWEKVAHGLGFVMQRVFFGIVFFAIITPVGLIRRLFVRDPLMIAGIADRTTAFMAHEGGIVRKEDLEKPF